MLVLSRKREERILIGDVIEIKVVAIHGNRVRLGITCPIGGKRRSVTLGIGRCRQFASRGRRPGSVPDLVFSRLGIW